MAGKKYTEAKKLVDSSKLYTYEEAVALAKKTSTTKFDSSVEVAFFLNVDPRQADQNIRGAIVLPNGNGKSRRESWSSHRAHRCYTGYDGSAR